MAGLRFAEDLAVAEVIQLGSYSISADEIRDFSRQWDPQPFHTDDASAAEGFFGSPIASGVHTLAVLQRLTVLGAYQNWAVLAGRRIRDVSLNAPVRAEMTLVGTLTVQTIRPTSPTRSLVTVHTDLRHEDSVVLGSTHDLYVWRRPVATS